MALFGKKDVNLPLLTQLYQVDPANEEEVLTLAVRCLTVLSSHPDRKLNETELTALRAFTQQFRQLITLVRRLMDTIAEDGTVYQTDIDALFGHWMYQYPLQPRLRPIYWRNTLAQLEPGRFPLQCYEFELEDLVPIEQQFIRRVLIDIFNNILEAQDKHNLLGICPECNSVFVVRKHHPDQMYCSNRCSSRVGERRRYLLRKIEKGSGG